MTETSFDRVVIGGGPGGYIAAIRAAQLGYKTALVEAEALGGVCLNWGCIPTKALLRTAEVKSLVEKSTEFGVKIGGKISLDWPQIIQRSRDISTRLTKGVEGLVRKNKIHVFKARGRLIGRSGSFHKIALEGAAETSLPKMIEAEKVILATGARAKTLPHLRPDGKHIWTAREAMMAPACPSSLLIVGSGAIGIEFASFFASMGCAVTVVEVMDRILPVEDHEISSLALKHLQKKGIVFHTSSKVLSLTVGKDKVVAALETPGGSQSISVEKTLLAIGIVGNTEDLGLETTKIKVSHHQIETNIWGETAEPGIYAIGDVAGAPWLAHKASHEGIIAVEHSAGLSNLHPLKKESIPGCTYCHPQIASIGLTEEKAKAKGLKVKVGRFPYVANGKALALGDTEGLIKVLFEETTGEFLGAHLIGSEVTELIQGFALAHTNELTEAEIMQTVFPHPTLSEMMHESVLDAYGRALHI